MIDQEVETTISIRKVRIPFEHRMSAKALLMALFPEMRDAGQLIIHFGPGKNPVFCEIQERRDKVHRGASLQNIA